MKGLNLPGKAALIATLSAALLAGALPATAQEDEERERQDMNIGNSGQMHTGQDERGNEVMVIKPKPKTQQEMPNMGTIYVVPQVNQGRGPAPVILPGPVPQTPPSAQTPQTPQTPQAPQAQPQAQTPVQQQMQSGQQGEPQVQPRIQPRSQPGQ